MQGVDFSDDALCKRQVPATGDAWQWQASSVATDVVRVGHVFPRPTRMVYIFTVDIRLYGTLAHFVAHLVFQEKYSLTTATSCRFLDRANEMRSFRTIGSLVRPQRSRSSQLYGRVPYIITGTHITGY